jgi:hypothetical protein
LRRKDLVEFEGKTGYLRVYGQTSLLIFSPLGVRERNWVINGVGISFRYTINRFYFPSDPITYIELKNGIVQGHRKKLT